MLQELTVPKHGETQTHDVIQYLKGKHNPIQKCVEVWGDIQCDSCDMILAKEGQTIKLGHKCWNCGTPVIAFTPVGQPERFFKVDPDHEFTDEEHKLIQKLAADMLEKEPEGKTRVEVRPMEWDEETLRKFKVTGHLRVIVVTCESPEITPEEQYARRRLWNEFYKDLWPDLSFTEAAGMGFYPMVSFNIDTNPQDLIYGRLTIGAEQNVR